MLQDFAPQIGHAETLMPGVRRVVAPNPSPMTFRGTNSYLVGTRRLALIDPGPNLPAHLDAIMAALTPEQSISHILVTHTHLDHSPLARAASERTGAPVYAFGDAQAGRSEIMQSLADAGQLAGGEGIDVAFVPDNFVEDGAMIEGDGWQLEALHTPGHIGNHLCFAWGRVCFSADHVMGWASSLVSPPDGDLSDFMASCATLQQREWDVFFPGHGAQIDDPAARMAWLVAHRLGREREILDVLARRPSDAAAIAAQIYTETPPALLGAATRNVLAHLIDLVSRGRAEPLGELTSTATFRIL